MSVENLRNVSRSMQNSYDFNASVLGLVKDQPAFKAIHGPAPNILCFYMLKMAGRAEIRHLK